MSSKIISHQPQHHHQHQLENSNIMDNKRQFNNNNNVSIVKHTFDQTNKLYVNNTNTNKKAPSYEELKRTRVVDKTYLLKLKEKRQRAHTRHSIQPSTANVSGTKFDIGMTFNFSM
jgi:hypothetical protein